MIYFGNQLNKISNNLNMLLNRYDIDFDILFNQISNIYFKKDNFQIMPYPSILDKLNNSKYFTISNSIKDLKFPVLLGDIDKKKIYKRLEKFYYKLEVDWILILEEDKEHYYIYDSDIAPYIKISKKNIRNVLLENILIVTSINKKIYYDEKILYQKNIENIYSSDLIGSNAYLEIVNILIEKKLLSKDELSLYYSIRELTILLYKLKQLSKKYGDKKIISLLETELNIFGKIINSICNREKQKELLELFLYLSKNRKDLEEYAKEYSTKLSY